MLEIEKDHRGVLRLWLNRPEKHNAMNAEMMDAIISTMAAITPGDPRVIVLAGRGKSFCAGGDLDWMRAQFEAGPAAREREARRLSTMLAALHACDVPIIGRLHGNAFGGGVGLASICDVAIGVRGRLLGLTETKLGLTPATIGPYVAARLGAKTRSVFMSSRVFDAQEAAELGLLGRVVGDEAALDDAIEQEIAAYLACAPGAVADAKRLARDLGPVIDDAVIERSLAALTARWEEGEAKEGLAAFFEKRPPSWARQP
ncbi:MAG: crotonase/enoyl-CoA hydratase family protein [Pseudomonadota bacterium]